MADPVERHKQQKEHFCVICAETTSEDNPCCQQCLQVKGIPPSEAVQVEGATWKPKEKKKKKKSKRKQVTEQNYNPSEIFKEGLEGATHKDFSQTKRSGHEPTKVVLPTKAGDNFGTSWWKLNSKSSQILSSEVKDPTKLTYKDFYGDSSDDETEGVFEKEDLYEKNAASVTSAASATIKGPSLEKSEKTTDKVVIKKPELQNAYVDSDEEKEDTSSKVKRIIKKNTSSAPALNTASSPTVSLEDSMSKLQLQKTEDIKSKEEKKETTGDQRSSTWGRCSHCKKEGYVLSCSRCKLSSYCGKECQKSHYPQHKAICKRKDKFNLIQSKIPDGVKMPFIKKTGGFNISPFLSDLPSEFDYALGARAVVMAEIIGPYFHLFRYGIMIKDLIGEETHILFYNKSEIYMDQTSKKSYPLAMCLRPGNFILLLDTHFHPFLDMTVGIRIDDLSQVHFIFDS